MKQQSNTPETDNESMLRSYRFSDAPDANIWINSDFARFKEPDELPHLTIDETLEKLAEEEDMAHEEEVNRRLGV